MPTPCIISAAVTGAIHTPSMSDALPITAADIARQAIDAAHAGAAIVHLHARDETSGQPDQSAQAYAAILPVIKAECDAIINITTGGAPTMSIEERIAPAQHWAPEVASLNMGSMNFGLFGMLNRFKKFKHNWEPEYLGNKNILFRNTFSDIEHIITTLSQNGTRFEFECYDTAHLYNLAHFRDQGLVEGPLFIQTVFGLLGGIGAHPDDVGHMKRTADRLFGDTYQWSVLGAGRNQMNIAAVSASQGGNVRVGLEDSLWIAPGKLAANNAEQVTKVRGIIEGLGRSAATPDQAREMLRLKGADTVNF